MELEGGLGQSWSLHRIAELRGRGEDGSAVARNAEADGPPLHGRRSAGLPAERRRSPRADLLTHVVQSDIARRPFAEADIERLRRSSTWCSACAGRGSRPRPGCTSPE
jgi:hypothetical protein